jgi:hypothetical protein
MTRGGSTRYAAGVSAGVSCETAIDLGSGYYSSPSTFYNSKTDFVSNCMGGYRDAIFYYSLPAGATITFDPPPTSPSFPYLHTVHEIRSGGSCPGTTQGACAGSSSTISFTNAESTSVDVYYIQTGFSDSEDWVKVAWTVSGTLAVA